MKLVSTYIETDYFNESIDFYKKIFMQEPTTYCQDRWVEFEVGSNLAIYNKKYDEKIIKESNFSSENFNKAYINDFLKERKHKINNIVTFNLYTDNLKEEYERIKKLNIKSLTEIMYVNIIEPYYYFNIKDPDGNTLEISSNHYN